MCNSSGSPAPAAGRGRQWVGQRGCCWVPGLCLPPEPRLRARGRGVPPQLLGAVRERQLPRFAPALRTASCRSAEAALSFHRTASGGKGRAQRCPEVCSGPEAGGGLAELAGAAGTERQACGDRVLSLRGKTCHSSLIWLVSCMFPWKLIP